MPPDYSEIESQRTRTAATADPVEDLRILKHAALQMQAILTASEWDTFTRQLEEWIAYTQRTVDQHTTALVNGDVIGEAATKAQITLAYARGLIDGLQSAMGLPQAILDQDAKLQTALGEKFFLTRQSTGV